MAYDYQYDMDPRYLDDLRRQEEEELRRMEEERRRQEEEARRAELMQTQPGAPVYDPINTTMPEPDPNQPGVTLGELMQGPPGNPYDVAPPVDDAPASPPMTYVHDPNRDYSANPLTGAEFEAFLRAGGNPHVEGATSYHGGSAFPVGTPTPDRKASEMDIDEFNKAIRGSELYQQFIHQRGLWRPNGGVAKWSDADREEWRRLLEANGVQIPKGMKIDDAGNLNQKNTLVKKLLIGGAVGAGAFFGAPAVAGLFGGGGAAAGAGAASAAAGAGAGTAAAAGGAAAAAGGAAAAGAAGAAAAGAAGMSWMPHVITGLAGLGSTALGARAQGKAADRAAAAQERGIESSERTLMAQLQFEREQREIERAEAQRRWEAEQEMARRMWEAQEDERLFRRRIFEEDRAARLGGGSYDVGPAQPSQRDLLQAQAQKTLAELLRQGTPGTSRPPATQAGPVGLRA